MQRLLVELVALTEAEGWPGLVGQPDDATLIAGIAEAQGPIGKNADYVFSLCDHLAAYGMPDAQLETLAARVREHMDKMA